MALALSTGQCSRPVLVGALHPSHGQELLDKCANTHPPQGIPTWNHPPSPQSRLDQGGRPW